VTCADQRRREFPAARIVDRDLPGAGLRDVLAGAVFEAVFGAEVRSRFDLRVFARETGFLWETVLARDTVLARESRRLGALSGVLRALRDVLGDLAAMMLSRRDGNTLIWGCASDPERRRALLRSV
jgi:hypothetical protein